MSATVGQWTAERHGAPAGRPTVRRLLTFTGLCLGATAGLLIMGEAARAEVAPGPLDPTAVVRDVAGRVGSTARAASDATARTPVTSTRVAPRTGRVVTPARPAVDRPGTRSVARQAGALPRQATRSEATRPARIPPGNARSPHAAHGSAGPATAGRRLPERPAHRQVAVQQAPASVALAVRIAARSTATSLPVTPLTVPTVHLLPPTRTPPALPPLSVPQLTVPQLTVPPLTVPPLTVPQLTVPQLTVPPLTVGPLTLPPLSVGPPALPPLSRPPLTVPPLTAGRPALPPLSVGPPALPPFVVAPVRPPLTGPGALVDIGRPGPAIRANGAQLALSPTVGRAAGPAPTGTRGAVTSPAAPGTSPRALALPARLRLPAPGTPTPARPLDDRAPASPPAASASGATHGHNPLACTTPGGLPAAPGVVEATVASSLRPGSTTITPDTRPG